MTRRASVLVLTLATVACGSSASPSGPTPIQSLASPAPRPDVPAGEWSLTTTQTFAVGTCAANISHMHVGESYDAWLLNIERSGTSIELVVSDLRNPTDRYEYEGTVVGDTVKAEIENYDVGAGWCGGRVPFTNESYLTGRFSEGGRKFTGEVVDQVRLESGDEIEIRTDWNAVQR